MNKGTNSLNSPKQIHPKKNNQFNNHIETNEIGNNYIESILQVEKQF